MTLLGAWKNIIEANADDTLKEWLTEYYDLLLSTWHAEVKHVMIKTQGKSYVTCKCLCEIFVLFHGGIALYTASLCFHYFRRFISILVHVCIYIYIMDIWLRIRRYLLYLNTIIVQSLFISCFVDEVV